MLYCILYNIFVDKLNVEKSPHNCIDLLGQKISWTRLCIRGSIKLLWAKRKAQLEASNTEIEIENGWLRRELFCCRFSLFLV